MVRLLFSLNGISIGWLHSRGSPCILVTSCILQLTANAWQTILISHHYHEIHFLIFILMMAPNSHHLIQKSRTFHRWFLPSFSSFGQGVSEEKIKMWKVNVRQTPSDGKSSHCLWQGELKSTNNDIKKLKIELHQPH
jgi:hypothetical protein